MLLKPILPVLEYVAFYDYIKNELCENKEIVEMKCNGKCYLAKEMAKASETSETGNDKKQTSIETSVVFFQEIIKTSVSSIFIYTLKANIPSDYNISYSFLDINSIFHPPKV
ncbi:hypothetical protein APS56_10385 [Pseudalgibacter alginicilyticus]|uniref:Uncharacterized protein n=2 Tax=Pseudalgibacter alginicilyticus TaxID=1736674 RepID=A0A0P0CH75_9FLAO|nr:hypothetical protein APS56_10385 [Pseudalgibacter alginicilyticus]